MTTKNSKTCERDQFTVVLESIRSDFRIFGEKLDFIDARLDRIDARLDRIEERIDAIEVRLDKIEARLDKVEMRLDRIEARLDKVELEMSELKTKLEKKSDIEKFGKLEERVKQIEIVLTRERKR